MKQNFDPSNSFLKNGQFFGLPISLEDAAVVILSAPWDVTTSYRDGTSHAPAALLEASYQLDLVSPLVERAWETKIGTVPLSKKALLTNKKYRALAKRIITGLERGQPLRKWKRELSQVNLASKIFHQSMETQVSSFLDQRKSVVTIGGDHSVSLGPITAYAKKFPSFSVLHIDAHADLRVAYEGFTYSHASIMNHVKDLSSVSKLVQVGIRDYSPDEKTSTEKNPKIKTYFDWNLQQEKASGTGWKKIAKEIVSHLDSKVYLSVDIDGLDPKYCPNTGTPVPGGIDIYEFYFLLEEILRQKKQVIGADLVEVGVSKSSDWDANVGARILFQLCQVIQVKA